MSRFSTRHSRRSAGQRALPDTKQQLFELKEALGPELSTPFALDVPEDLVNFGVCGASAFRQVNNSRAAFVRHLGPDNIPETFEASEELVHGLLADAGTFGKHPRANPIRPRKLQNRHMRHPELLETGRVQLVDDTAMDRLRRNAQQGSNKHMGFQR